ncbi:MAG: SRPBCC family protein [Candidatus Flexifilum sp.]|jgi:uncharacterized protein YndB with AHSA1/START domain
MLTMNTLDRRILIPAPQAAVWAAISDLAHSGAWNADWQQVAFLTTKREGRATRFRCRDSKGKEAVVEITAWYNGLGFEYTYIDGLGLKNPIGRIRLQEIPEGTIVQWTFQWEGSRGAARKLESRLEDNLKALYRQVTQAGRQPMTESKSSMREAVSFSDRSHYQPRHPSAMPTPAGTNAPAAAQEFTFDDLDIAPVTGSALDLQIEPPLQTDDARLIPAQPEAFDFALDPPIREDDTRPRPAIEAVASQIPVLPPLPEDIEGEPDFLDELIIELDSPIGPAFDFDAVTPASADTASPTASIGDPVAVPDVIEDISALILDAAPLPPAASGEAAADVSAPPPVEQPPAAPPVTSSPADLAAVTPASTAQTGEIKSIWEVFGIPKPTETIGEPSLAVESAPAEQPEAGEASPVSPPISDDTAPLKPVEVEADGLLADRLPKPPPGLMEALESLRSGEPIASERPPRRGGHRARMRLRRVRIRRPV